MTALITESDPAVHTVVEEPTPRFGPVGALYDRFRHLIHELGKFGIIGAFAFVIDFGIFNGLHQVASLEDKPLSCKIISVAVAATFAFFGNRYWTWRHWPRSSLRREYGLYLVFNVIGLMLALIPLGISHYLLGAIWPAFTTLLADNIAANVVGTVFGTVFRFWSFRRWVFLKPESQ